MTTLEAIGYTTAGCGTIAAFTFAFFAVAVRTRSYNIAPRCTARSKDTIYNPKAKRGKRSFFLFGGVSNSPSGRKNLRGKGTKDHFKKMGGDKDDFHGAAAGDDDASIDSEKETREEVQYRGGPMFGWIPWTLSISFDQLLTGVPGTGTRKGGMEGSLLRVNLDGIVLLRFHALCLRVSILATIIGIGLILPLNITARCFSFSEDDVVSPQCNSTDYNITNYEQTTLANIPSLDAGSGSGVSWIYGWFGSSVSIFGSKFSSYLGRLYAVVAFSWILVFYTLHLMKKEWVDALALRRVYYLEGWHWENRVAELHQTVLNYESDDSEYEDEEKTGALERRRMINRRRVKRNSTKKKKRKDVKKRDPWIPHPEQRETVPNIELYSVLVGNVPSLPSEIAAEGDLESMGFSRRECLDWQLAVTAAFFDQCVPNQPGFSSSVAAVTILPDAPKLAKAWRAWYKHVGLLRRLRFVRSLIAKKRYYEIDEVGEEDEDESGGSEMLNSDAPLGDGKSLDVLFPLDQSSSNSEDEARKQMENGNFFGEHAVEDHLDITPDVHNGLSKEYSDMRQLQLRINYYKDVFGADIDAEGGLELEKTLIMHALEYGPEQTAVYSREFAQGAAACCPNGCREERLHYYELKDLEILEEEITHALVKSFEDLTNVQKWNVDNQDDSKAAPEGQTPAIQNVGSMEDIKLPSKYDTESRLYSRTPIKFTPEAHEGTGPDANHMSHSGADFTHRSNKNEQSQHMFDHESPLDGPLHLAPRMSSGISYREASRITLSNQGRVYLKESNYGGPRGDGVHGGSFGSHSSQIPQSHKKDAISTRGEWPKDSNQNGLRTRQRVNTGVSQMSFSGFDSGGQWEKVQQIIHDDEVAKGVSASDHRRAFSGAWKIPTISSIFRRFREKISTMRKRTKNVVEDFASDSTFAVVTFTSRQAAIAARHCLADGRGADRWIPVEDIPVPPLADAAAGDLKTCRGCCRPVTLTVNPKQQFVRKYTAIFMLANIFVFYTVPLTLIANLAAPENIKKVIPGLAELANVNPFMERLLQGFVPAVLNSIFFSLCPVMFKAISNFGSNAISVNQAEYNALQYYWAFMVVTAFSGTSLAQIGLAYLGGKQAEGNTFTTILIFVAGRLPGQVSANWLNWIILRSLVILPMQYMLQVNTFIFQWLGWKCCRRCVMGGGPGGPVPYRIYIDSGVVFMCIVALSPVSPLVAPASMLYFLYCAPLWRRNCIYIYRPKFDTGGLRWPFLSDVLISSLCVGQVLLTTAMALKEAVGPAILSAFPIIPILVHRRFNRKRYLKSYLDCALLQTSQLDGWDNHMPTSREKREEYRKFLVDAHKAAYVPICIASSNTSTKLTAEPALVVDHENDVLQPVPMPDMNTTNFTHQSDTQQDLRSVYSNDRVLGGASLATPNGTVLNIEERAKIQPFASFRRLKQTSFIDQGAVGSESFGLGD